MSKTIVVYFSASGVTMQVAERLATSIRANIYEIKPAVPYTNADLNWMNKQSRSSIEMQDHNSRPEILEDGFSFDEFDTIFLGFPIWWYVAPTIVNTFLEKHDFSNKKIIVFATSGGSTLGGTVEKLKKSVSDSTNLVEGAVLKPDVSIDELKAFAEKYI